MAGTFQNDYAVIDGIRVFWTTPPSTLVDMKTFEVREDDVFIVTFPKSGTHWLMEIVYLLLANGELSKIKRNMMEQGLEHTQCAGPSEVQTAKPGHKYMEEWESPRVMNSHLMLRFLPPQIWEKKAKVLYVARNPKDVVCSMYHFMYAILPEEQRDWSNFVKFFTAKEMIGGDWFTHVYEYWTQCKGRENFLFIKYEDLKKNHRGMVKQVAEFLGKNLSEEVIDKITSLTTIDAMRKTYDELEAEPGSNMRRTKAFGVLSFLNKGNVGSWKEQMSEEQSKLFDEKLAETFKDTDFTLECE
ncbi:sulfotransferase 1C2-like [Amphiura filiformis]|uniref:sulfotransferase 1C2-like n=1 Tax=Amphiura filiformis TaxID=82378 RepID=UPI003B228B50